MKIKHNGEKLKVVVLGPNTPVKKGDFVSHWDESLVNKNDKRTLTESELQTYDFTLSEDVGSNTDDHVGRVYLRVTSKFYKP